jgi:hypothetical protein
MSRTGHRLGPGSVRVGCFIGRLGVVALPAVGVGLGLAERVVRRHVARLERLGWLNRTSAIRGDGSLLWLTRAGLRGVGLADLAVVRAPDPFSAQTLHSVQVAWTAAVLEQRGVRWLAVRELELDAERWAVPVANERGGHSPRLPDLVAWPATAGGDQLPVAVIIDRGLLNRSRRRRLLDGFHAAVAAGQYREIRSLPGGQAGAHQLERLAADLAAPQIAIVDQELVDEVDPAAGASEPPPVAPSSAPEPPKPRIEPAPVPPAVSPAEAAERAAARQRLIDQLLGVPDPKPRRRWRRR